MAKEGFYCDKCKFFKYQHISFIHTKHIEGERHNSYMTTPDMSEEEIAEIKNAHKIPHHEIVVPSGYCSPKIQMCQHPVCFGTKDLFLMGMPAYQVIRIAGQGQLNPYGECKYYKRKFLSIG